MHRTRSCIDNQTADGSVRAMKIRLDSTGPWHNEIAPDGTTATIAANPRTVGANNRVWSGQDVFHVLSYRSGDFGTNYHGRFRCVGGKGQGRFDLTFVDTGAAAEKHHPTAAATTTGAPAAAAPPPLIGAATTTTTTTAAPSSDLALRWTSHLRTLMVPHVASPGVLRDGVGEPAFWLPTAKTFLHVQPGAATEDDLRRWSRCAADLGFAVMLATGNNPATAQWSVWNARARQPVSCAQPVPPPLFQ